MDDLRRTRPWWRKKRWSFALSAWLLMVYPLGYGPAFGYYWRTGDPRLGTAFDAVYGPMESLRYDGPAPVSAAAGWYIDLWMPEGWNDPWACPLGVPSEPTPDGPGDGVPSGGTD